MVHHPIIQEMDEQLAKSSLEPWMGGAGLHSTLSNFFMHIPSFKMPTIRQVWYLIQHGDYSFLMILRMLIYIFLLLSITKLLYGLSGNTNLFSWKVLSFGLDQLLGFSLHLLIPYCSFADARVFMLKFICMLSWTWRTQSVLAGGHKSICILYWFIVDSILIFIFKVWTSSHLVLFFSRTMLG